MFCIEVWSSFLYLSHQCCYADSFFLSIRFLRSCNKLRSRCCRTHLRLELFHSVTLFLCTCFLELELLIFFVSLWCSLNLICLPAPPVTSCDLFSIDNKICFVKKKPSPSHHQLTCWFRLYWSYVSFTTSCIIPGTQNLALNFIYYSSSLLFYLF